MRAAGCISLEKTLCVFEKRSLDHAAVLDLPVTRGGAGGLVGREELIHGELHMAEDLTGIVLVAAAGALLLGQAVVVDGHEELGVPLQPDDGELAQGNIQAVNIAAGMPYAESGIRLYSIEDIVAMKLSAIADDG